MPNAGKENFRFRVFLRPLILVGGLPSADAKENFNSTKWKMAYNGGSDPDGILTSHFGIPSAVNGISQSPAAEPPENVVTTCLVKSRPMNQQSLDDLLSARGTITVQSAAAVLIVPAPTIGRSSYIVDGPKMTKLRQLLDSEAVLLDPNNKTLYKIGLDGMTLLRKLSELGFVPTQFFIGADEWHTWSVQCYEPKPKRPDQQRCSSTMSAATPVVNSVARQQQQQQSPADLPPTVFSPSSVLFSPNNISESGSTSNGLSNGGQPSINLHPPAVGITTGGMREQYFFRR